MDAIGLFPQTRGFKENWDLHTSSKAGDILRVKYLVEQLDQDVNERDEHNTSPLFYACLCGHSDIVRYLLDCGSRLIPGLFETERCFYGALTDDIRNVLRDHKANPNKFDHLAQNMRGLRSMISTTDFVMIVTDPMLKEDQTKHFNLHRFVLSARSTFFANALLNDWFGESEITLTCGHDELFPSITLVTALLDYIYTGNVDIDENESEAFVSVLKKFGFSHLSTFILAEKNRQSREIRRLVLKLDSERSLLTQQLAGCFSHFSGHNPNDLDQVLLRKDAWHDICLEIEETNTELDDSNPQAPKSNFHRYACHKALLSQHSAYFHALTTGSFSEASALRASTSSIPVLRMDSIRPELFKEALFFLYTNSLETDFNIDDTAALLLLGDQLMLMELKRLCAIRLRKHLSVETVFSFLQLGDRHQVRVLRDACLTFVEHHIAELHKSPLFEEAQHLNSEFVAEELRLYLTDYLERHPEQEVIT